MQLMDVHVHDRAIAKLPSPHVRACRLNGTDGANGEVETQSRRETW